MVAIAIEPNTASMGTKGIALVTAILLEQIVATEYLGLEKCQRLVFLLAFNIEQVARQDNLIEQVPGIVVL